MSAASHRSVAPVRRPRLRGLVSLALLPAVLVPSGARRPAAPVTPIDHLVVIYQENVSFDHYFGTYPKAKNPSGEPRFVAKSGTPHVNGLTLTLRTHNKNLANPYRLDRSQAFTCDNKHAYPAEQKAFDGGKMDKFVQYTGPTSRGCPKTLPMGYFDGNTVTALWNYAQRFTMSDAFFGTGFGPSTVGAVNLVSGNTHGVGATTGNVTGKVSNSTIIGDPDPGHDDCSGGATAELTGQNVGDLLNTAGVSWGWFEGGFTPSSHDGLGAPICKTKHKNINGTLETDYTPHHEPFQYYSSTANPHHAPPQSVNVIGLNSDQPANHQYDLSDFWAAANGGFLPSVSFLKAPGSQDGHPNKSDPLDEQKFLVNTINKLQKLAGYWPHMAIVIAYDDSDGWYDHVFHTPVNSSSDATYDFLNGAGQCGPAVPPAGGYEDRCGYGPRLPLLVISPYARVNYVGHTTLDQTSILRFIEDNWSLGKVGDSSMDSQAGDLQTLFDFVSAPHTTKLILSPTTGEPA